MSLNGLSLSQWDSIYANQIPTSFIFKLRLEIIYQSSIVITELSAIKINSDIKIGIDGSEEVKVDGV